MQCKNDKLSNNMNINMGTGVYYIGKMIYVSKNTYELFHMYYFLYGSLITTLDFKLNGLNV